MPLYYLRPRAAGFYGGGGNWTFVGSGSYGDYRNVDPGPNLTHDDAVSAIREAGASGVNISFLVTALPAGISAIRSVRAVGRLADSANVSYGWFARLGGVDGSGQYVYGDISGGTYRTVELPATDSIARPGGGAWTIDDLRSTTLEIGAVSLTNPGPPVSVGLDITSLYFVVDAVSAPVKIAATRDFASRFLRLLRGPVRLITVRAPLLYAGLEIGDYVTLSHEHGPDPSGEGWGRKSWQRRLLQVMGHEVDLDGKAVKLSLLDVRPYRVLLWDPALTREPPGPQGQGLARLSVGARQFSRASKAWVQSAAAAAQGATQLVQLDTDVEKQETFFSGSPLIASGGLLIERAATNALLHSAFASGLTGWTASGTPAPATSTTRLLFESSVTPNVIRFAPTALAAPCQIQSAAFNPGAVTEGCVSFWHYDETGHALYYAIQRASDSKWWNDATATWDVAQVWNAMAVSAGKWGRHASKRLDAGLASTNITLYVGVPTTGVVGQVNYLAHGQAENCNYPTSAMVTTTAAFARIADDLKIENAHGRLVWPRKRGTLILIFTPLWSQADLVAGATMTLVQVQYDASNLDRLLYRQANADLVMRRRIAGENYQTNFTSPALTRGVPLKLAVRWASPEGEEGMADRQVDLFANGVKLASVTPPSRVAAFPSVSYLSLGSYLGTSASDGHFSGIEVRDYVMSDEEILDLHG